MKKLFVILVTCMILLMGSGVFALSIELPPELEGYVTSVLEMRKEITINDITGVKQVDFNNLPDEITIENIDQGAVSIYQIDIVDGKPVYIISASREIFQRTLEPVDIVRSYLSYGYEGSSTGSGFLDTSAGVLTDLQIGYIMMRDGSITGMSTNLGIIKESQDALIDIIIYKNGQPLGFGNTLSAASAGMKTDYDILSEDTITFEAGDIISVYISSESEAVWSDVVTMVEITTQN